MSPRTWDLNLDVTVSAPMLPFLLLPAPPTVDVNESSAAATGDAKICMGHHMGHHHQH